MKSLYFTIIVVALLSFYSNRIQAQTIQTNLKPTNELIQAIQMRNYEGLKFVPQIFEGETHISVYGTALTHGLMTIFKR